MKTKKHTQEIQPIVVVAVISGIIMFVSGIGVVGSATTLFPPVATVVFVISAVITFLSVVYYNRVWGN